MQPRSPAGSGATPAGAPSTSAAASVPAALPSTPAPVLAPVLADGTAQLSASAMLPSPDAETVERNPHVPLPPTTPPPIQAHQSRPGGITGASPHLPLRSGGRLVRLESKILTSASWGQLLPAPCQLLHVSSMPAADASHGRRCFIRGFYEPTPLFPNQRHF